MEVELAALGGGDGGEQVLEDDALAGGGALVRHADVLGRVVLEGGLLGGADAGGLVLARLLGLSHDEFPISPKMGRSCGREFVRVVSGTCESAS